MKDFNQVIFNQSVIQEALTESNVTGLAFKCYNETYVQKSVYAMKMQFVMGQLVPMSNSRIIYGQTASANRPYCSADEFIIVFYPTHRLLQLLHFGYGDLRVKRAITNYGQNQHFNTLIADTWNAELSIKTRNPARVTNQEIGFACPPDWGINGLILTSLIKAESGIPQNLAPGKFIIQK